MSRYFIFMITVITFLTFSQSANSRGKSFKVEGIYQEGNAQAQRLIENEYRADREYAERQRSSTAIDNSTNGSRYVCKIICRGSLWATGSEFTLETFASDGDKAREQAKDQAEKTTCKGSGQGDTSRAWWAEARCEKN